MAIIDAQLPPTKVGKWFAPNGDQIVVVALPGGATLHFRNGFLEGAAGAELVEPEELPQGRALIEGFAPKLLGVTD